MPSPPSQSSSDWAHKWNVRFERGDETCDVRAYAQTSTEAIAAARIDLADDWVVRGYWITLAGARR